MRKNIITSNIIFRSLLLILALSVPLAGCGIKPNQVDPPPGAEDETYPRTYPDPQSDLPVGGPAPF